MEEAPATRASLLVRIRDPQDKEAWRQFYELYAALIYGFARKRGLQDADAADLMQDVLRTVASAANRLEYDPRRGSFRGWLFTVTRNRLYSFLEGRKRQVHGTGDSGAQKLLEQQQSGDDAVALWDQEYQRRLFAWAVERVRNEFQQAHWQAFWQTAVEGKPAKEVAQNLGLTPGAVYVAKSRVLAKVKEQIQQLQAE